MNTDYRCVTDIGEVKAYLAGHDRVSFDYETAPDAEYRSEEKAALDPAKAHICTMSLSVKEHTAIMIPVAHLTGNRKSPTRNLLPGSSSGAAVNSKSLTSL